MNKMHKVIILFFGAFALFGVAKEWVYKNDKNVIIVDGHYVSKTPCMGAMNQVYGRGIDSVKICDCMIPKFYELIKNDPSQIKKFEEMGIFTLEGPLYDSTTKMFEYCASHSILDSNYKLSYEPISKKYND